MENTSGNAHTDMVSLWYEFLCESLDLSLDSDSDPPDWVSSLLDSGLTPCGLGPDGLARTRPLRTQTWHRTYESGLATTLSPRIRIKMADR